MKSGFIISIKVHPVVKKWMEFNVEKKQGSYLISKCKYYPMIISSLTRCNFKHQSKIPKKFETFEEINFIISEFDFYHYGFFISDYLQYKISDFIYKDIVDEMLKKTMYVHCSTGIARDKIMRQLLVEYMFEENEMSLANFRKMYQRKILDKEKDFYFFLEDCEFEV